MITKEQIEAERDLHFYDNCLTKEMSEIYDLAAWAVEHAKPMLEYFVARCEGRHEDGFIRSQRTLGMFKTALAELSKPSETGGRG